MLMQLMYGTLFGVTHFYSFAIREGSTKVKLFRNFKERKSFKPEFGAEGNNISDTTI